MIHSGSFKKGRIVPKLICDAIGRGNKGKIRSEKFKENLKGKHNSLKTEFKKGIHYNTHTEFKKGQIPWNKGRQWTEEERMKISKSHIGIQAMEKHPLWQGGKSFEPYGIKFNRKLKGFIRKRDNYTCQECGYIEEKLGYNLHIHHIDYNKQNNNPSNLIGLCRTCHLQTNFNRGDWEKYFGGKICTGT